MDDALRSAGHVGVSEVLRDALTCCSVPLPAAHGVGATRRGITGVDIFYFGGR